MGVRKMLDILNLLPRDEYQDDVELIHWDLIHTQHHHNNHTTITHMSVGPSVWGPPSCEGLLCGCCVGDVNLTFSITNLDIRENKCNFSKKLKTGRAHTFVIN